MKNNFESFFLWEDTHEDQSDLKNMINFIEKTLFELQGFQATRKVLIKRKFEMFINSSDGETDSEESSWGL